jgi:transposase
MTHCYKQKKSSQFTDFINKVDSSYDPSIKQIFIVLDNASIHRSKKTREAMKKKHSRIVLFLPTKAPELNLIEVRWMWMQRMAINNSIFENESDIGKAVSDWTKNNNETHSNTTSQSRRAVIIRIVNPSRIGRIHNIPYGKEGLPGSVTQRVSRTCVDFGIQSRFSNRKARYQIQFQEEV